MTIADLDFQTEMTIADLDFQTEMTMLDLDFQTEMTIADYNKTHYVTCSQILVHFSVPPFFNYERTRWRVFRKRIIRTKLDI